MAQPLTIARPYAKAIFALVQDDDHAQNNWLAFLKCATEVISNPDISQHLNQSGFLIEMEQWIDTWLHDHRKIALTQEEKNLLLMLEKHNRLMVLPQILEEFIHLRSYRQNSVIARIRTAESLNKSAQQSLRQALVKKTGSSDVVLEIEEDKSLMAGVIIEYDGQVIDYSMSGRLTQFARKLGD